MKVELKKMEVRWERDGERIAKEMYDAIRKGELADWCQEFFEKEVRELCETDSGLSLADAYSMVMETSLGYGLYKTYCDMERDERQSTKATVSKGEQADYSVGSATRKVYEKAEREVEKSHGKISENAAIERVFAQDPDLYNRYVEEETLSTAVR